MICDHFAIISEAFGVIKISYNDFEILARAFKQIYII